MHMGVNNLPVVAIQQRADQESNEYNATELYLYIRIRIACLTAPSGGHTFVIVSLFCSVL